MRSVRSLNCLWWVTGLQLSASGEHTPQVSERDCRTILVQGLDVKVWRKYEDFVEELSERFPHERKGIKKFYGECWAVFNSLNLLELKSLEEPRYLLGGRHLSLNPLPPSPSLSLSQVF